MDRLAKGESALGLLRLLLVGSIVVPLLCIAAVGWITYQGAFQSAEREQAWISEVAREHATKVFDSQKLVSDRVEDMLHDLDDEAISRAEPALNANFRRIVAELPQIQSFVVIDGKGHPLVATGAMPVSRDTDFSDRDYFQALKSGARTYVSKVQESRIDGRPFFGLGTRREGPAGEFRGVIDIAISPAFFAQFYKTLIEQGGTDPAGRIVTMLREDGQVLARFPPLDGPFPKIPPTDRFFDAIRRSPYSGAFLSPVASSLVEHSYAYRKVQGYPVYIIVERSLKSILGTWRRQMLGYLAFGIPGTAALFLITLTALRRARREQLALAQVREEMYRRQVAEDALQRAQRLEAVGQLTGGIAHDFNNLLTIILGNVDIMVRKAEDAARVRRLGEHVLLAARRGAEVTDKLLAFSRRQIVRPETVDPNELLREFKPLLDRGASERMQVVFDLAPGTYPVHIDPGQFEAAILNLIVNARDAMPEGGRVVVSTRNVVVSAEAAADASELKPGIYVRVAVADSGTGMTAQTMAKAFEPFFTTKEVGKGTGLGLSQVYGFAKQSGGHARIESVVGRGTTVELFLPRAVGLVIHERAPVASAPLRRAERGEVVLVVEDEPTVLEMAIESLRDLGYQTLTARNASAALEHLKGDARIDLLFSDVVLAGSMDGVQLALEARRLRPQLKVILTSGYADPSQTARVPDDIPLLVKPYVREDLASKLAVAMTRG